MDERAARIVVVPGETDEIVTVGWEVRDRPALLRVQETLQSAGVGVKQLPQEEADARRVEEAITFCDPTGTTIEVFHGAVLDHSPVVTPFGARFVTGAQGLGHVVLPATDPTAACSTSTPTCWVFSPAARGECRHHRSSARCGSGSSASTSDTTAWRSFPSMRGALPGSST